MFENFFTKIWYGKTLPCRTSLKSGTAAAVPAVPAAPPMVKSTNNIKQNDKLDKNIVMHRPLIGGNIKRCYCLTSVCLSDVCMTCVCRVSRA